ncbi:MAG: PadR family transcriptional regulator [Bacteroidaceae bacterium]|nr:PadR family transcriptional regulator [Bacteroidaceae bacterium]
MNVDNAKSQMRKGMLEYCIMLLLKDQACYSSDIIGRLKEANLLVVEGTLYPLLTRLRKEGVLEYEWQESTQGPPRKYYVLSQEGRQALAAMEEAWSELETTVRMLKQSRLPYNNV